MTTSTASSMSTTAPSADPLRLGVITGSTRPGRRCDVVAEWVVSRAAARPDLNAEMVDISSYRLPLLDEPLPAISGVYERPHTTPWSSTIASFDAFVFVTPEYNHSMPGALKNAIDFLYHEWRDKAAGFVSYGMDAAGARATEQLRLVMAEVHVADVRAQVALSITEDFSGDDGYSTLRARPHFDKKLDTLLEEVTAWGGALRSLRREQAADESAA